MVGFPGGMSGKEPACHYRRHRHAGLIPGWPQFSSTRGLEKLLAEKNMR